MGFTLIELIAVVGVLAVMAASAAPALHRIETSRQSGARDEVARLLSVARASSLATGDVYGVEVNEDNESVRLVYIDDAGSPAPAPVGGGQESRVMLLGSLYPGVEIESFVNGSGNPSHTTIWFGYGAVPETRNPAGKSPSGFTQDAAVTLSGGLTVTVRRQTGAIE
ncbi:MAG: pilus assembly FimT family protein [Planctomycetota bacterium]|jgi:prepilin-type N-terminal cleavage/methylation domain-containing protein